MTRPSFYSFSLHLTTNYIAKAYISIYEARARVTISGSGNFTQIALVHSRRAVVINKLASLEATLVRNYERVTYSQG